MSEPKNNFPLQKTAEHLYRLKEPELSKNKKVKRLNQGFIALAGFLFFMGGPDLKTKENLSTLLLIGSMLSFVSFDYKRKQEKAKHEVLFSVKEKEIKTCSTFNETQLKEDLLILTQEKKSIGQRNGASLCSISSLALLGGSCFADKISVSTACLAASLIMTAATYWEKENYKNLNLVLKHNLQNKIQFNWCEKERE